MTETPPTAAPPPSGAHLRRNYLSGIENVAQSIGTMGPVATIGTILPLLIYKSGNGSWLLLLGILGAFCLVSTSINVFASRFASAGSLSAYARKGLGNGAGSLAGWSYLVAMAFVVTSSAVSSAYYVAIVVTHITGRPLETAGCVISTIAVVLLAWWPAHRDIKVSTKTMLATEAFSAAIVIFILAAGMLHTHRVVDGAQLRLEGTGFSGMRLGFVLAFMTLAGFESASALGEEAKSATSTLPRVMMLCVVPTGILFVLSIYCLTALSHSLNLSLDQTDAPLDMIAQSIGLPALGWMSSLGVAISCFGCALGGLNAGSRVLYSMAKERELWPYFEAIHPVNGTPHRALAFFASIAVLVPCVLFALGVTMSDAMDYLMQLASFGFLGAYLLVCLAAAVFLAGIGELGAVRVAVAVLAIAILCAAFVLSLIPVPEGPWRYLPYVFAGLLAAGMGVTSRMKRARPADTPSGPSAAKPAG